MQRILSTVGLLLLAPVLARGDEAAKSFSIPFEMLPTQHMAIKVKINGKGPYRIIFDTGAPDSLLSNKVAKEAKLAPKNAKQSMFGPFGARGQFTIQTLEAGDLKADNLSTMVLDHPTVEALASAVGPIEGILGFTFFAHYRTTIDYQKGRITLEPVDYEPGDVLQAILKKFLAPKNEREAPPVIAPAGLLGLRVTKAEKDEEPGVTVEAVLPGGAAAEAGLKAGDRLLTLDRRWTDTVTDCYLAAGGVRPGTPAEAVVERQGKRLTLKVEPRPGL
jgi:hypothetical protein